MAITLNGTTGITTPDVNSDGLTVDSTTLVVDEANNQVGIGTTSHYDASTKLTVDGRMNVSNGTVTGSMNYGGGSVLNVGTLSNHNLQLMTNNTTRATIDTSGALLVGVASATVGSGNAHHLITAGNELNLAASTTSGTLYFNYRSGTTLTSLRFMSGTGTSTYVACYGTSFTNSSDYRIKTDVQEVGSVLPKVAQLRPVNYIKEGVEGREFGLIAHEAQALFPDMVSGEKDAVDEDGDMEIQGIDYAQLSTILVKAIQEQQAIIDSLETRIAALEAA